MLYFHNILGKKSLWFWFCYESLNPGVHPGTNIAILLGKATLLKIVDIWGSNYHLKLNVGKCKVILFFKNIYPIIHNNYYIDEDVLDRCSNFKNLEVTFDLKLTFKDHFIYFMKLLGYFLITG